MDGKTLVTFLFDGHTHDGLDKAIDTDGKLLSAMTDGHPVICYMHGLWNHPNKISDFANYDIGNVDISVPAIGDIYIFTAYMNTTNWNQVSAVCTYE